MILATAFDPSYSLGDAYEASLRAHCNIPFRIFSIGVPVEGRITVERPNMPHILMQEGGFLRYLDDLRDDGMVIFTDADLFMQRPFSEAELGFIDGFKSGEIGCGINQRPGATLDEEYDQLFPVKTKDEVDAILPGFREQPIWNMGMVLARKETYARLYAEFLKVWPEMDLCFMWHPRVQFTLSYLIGTKFQHVLIPPAMHSHGHCGIPAGVNHRDGKLFWNDELVLFRHKI